MTELTTFAKELWEVYELHYEEQSDATSPTITVSGKLPHADVIASSGHKLERTRVYINGVRADVTAVATIGSDTTITVSDTIVVGDEVDIFLATSTGTLKNNTTTGKIPLIELQVLQMYDASSNMSEQEACGTERIEETEYSSDGTAAIGLHRRGADDLENFISALENDKYLMIIVKDTTDPANTTYDILHEVDIEMYGSGGQAFDGKGGEIAIMVALSFVPDVAVTV